MDIRVVDCHLNFEMSRNQDPMQSLHSSPSWFSSTTLSLSFLRTPHLPSRPLLIPIQIRPVHLLQPLLRIVIRPNPQRKTEHVLKTHLPLRTHRPSVSSTNIIERPADTRPVARRPALVRVPRVGDTHLDALVAVVHQRPPAAEVV